MKRRAPEYVDFHGAIDSVRALKELNEATRQRGAKLAVMIFANQREFEAWDTMAQAVTWDYAPARMDLIRQWEQRGAKKGDAAITAHLEGAAIRYLVSENRDFLKELPSLPFTVLSSEEAVRLLGESGS